MKMNYNTNNRKIYSIKFILFEGNKRDPIFEPRPTPANKLLTLKFRHHFNCCPGNLSLGKNRIIPKFIPDLKPFFELLHIPIKTIPQPFFPSTGCPNISQFTLLKFSPFSVSTIALTKACFLKLKGLLLGIFDI
jgi:hypothetical protein